MPGSRAKENSMRDRWQKSVPRLSVVIFAIAASVLLAGAPEALAISASNIAVSEVGETSAVLVVKTDVTSDVSVDYGTAPGVYTTTRNSNAVARHEVTLDGLSPSTTIYYRVSMANSSNPADTATLDEASFSSASAAGDPFSFAVTGDNRPNADTVVQPDVWSTIVAQVMGENVHMVLSVGDIIYGMADDSLARNVAKMEGFFATTSPMTAFTPLYVAAGNHELINFVNNRTGYEQEFTFPENNGADAGTYPEEYYSFDNGDVHFIALCTEIPGQEGRITGNQLAWLESDLAAGDRVWTVVFMHRPLFSGLHPFDPWVNLFDPAGQQNKADLHALFLEHGVDVVFEGHEHHYMHHEEDGIHYVISGGGGAPLKPPFLNDPGDIYGSASFQHVKVDETTARMDLVCIDSGGSSLESFTLWSLDFDISASDIYWASLADYHSRQLNVNYLISNSDSTDISNIQVLGLEASSGVMPVTSTPFAVTDIPAGGNTNITVEYQIPEGVSTFNALAYVTCQDALGNVYEMPGPMS